MLLALVLLCQSSAHSSGGRSAVHIIHHRTSAIVHLVLANRELACLFLDFRTFRHLAIILLARSGVHVEQPVDAGAQSAASCYSDGAIYLVSQYFFHFQTVLGTAAR